MAKPLVSISLENGNAPLLAQKKSSKLSTPYFYYVLYESVLINLIGFVTLFFQCELQRFATFLHEKFPSISLFTIESLTGHYWLQGDLN